MPKRSSGNGAPKKEGNKGEDKEDWSRLWEVERKLACQLFEREAGKTTFAAIFQARYEAAFEEALTLEEAFENAFKEALKEAINQALGF